MADIDTGLGQLTEPTQFTIQRWLPGPAERIWRYLTESDLRRKWLAAGDMPAVAGGAFELVWRNDELSRPDDTRPAGFPEENRMESRILVFDPPRHLTFSWGDGEVSFKLEPKGDRVLLTLVHSGLGPDNRIRVAAGWHTHLDIMVAEAEGVAPGSFWSNWTARTEVYRARLVDV